MSQTSFHQVIPDIDKTTEWFLNEIVYCLEHYVKMDEKSAREAILSSRLIELIRNEDPSLWMWREPAFHWAMCIIHGFDSSWWHDKKLWNLYGEYVRERHHPPTSG